MFELFGLLLSLALLVFLTMRGINIIVSAIACSILLALTNHLNVEQALTDYYMNGFTGFLASWFLIFMVGAVFGQFMLETKAADAIAEWISRTFGPERAVFAVVAACAIMTYGGVSVFIVGFTLYPIAVALFQKANLPHRFIPAALVFGSISFTMTSPGSPEVQNLIPTEYFQTTPTAGGVIGVLIGLLIMVAGGLALGRMVRKAKAQGEGFQLPVKQQQLFARDEKGEATLPHPLLSLIPLLAVVVLLNILAQFMAASTAALLSLSVGVALIILINYKFLRKFWDPWATGTQNALIATANTCAVVGFGSVAAEATSFQAIVDSLVHIPASPLLGLAIGVTVISGITGSATGGLGIALPLLAPIYMAQGLDPGAMHRVSALASGGLDSLPHNGYVVTTVRVICGETHERAYKPIFMLSVVIPTLAVLLSVLLYTIF
ncbi:GntP family permease [Numidum massiliense]|uniref:GntP family permease n=1 Tax=Numidum massiliense TaxID=1522315 RepID=UPI000A8CF069|nr:GntP family permease [Numidum massiliense]